MDATIFYRVNAFNAVRNSALDPTIKLAAIADMIRHNVITQVRVANTGHIGTSLSAADILAILYHERMDVDPADPQKVERDVFLYSKGHASPLAYAVVASRGFIPDERLLGFRRLNGLGGHVDVSVPGCDSNSGSLGMGISKAKGHAWAMKRRGSAKRAFVMCGDGELQEGQNWESLQSAPSMKLGNLMLILDKNLVQTDALVENVLIMPSVEAKLRAFGWNVIEVVDGNDVARLRAAFDAMDSSDDIPKALVITTVKGKGVSFMEHPIDLANHGVYRWHNKVPSYDEYLAAVAEIHARLESRLSGETLPLSFWPVSPLEFPTVETPWIDDYVVRGYTKALLELIPSHPEIVVVDGDLAIDCGIRDVEIEYPANFLEVGIAEQDMVSMSGSMAFQGLLPIVNTFSAFLSSRANEQIFNNVSEHTKVVYVGHLAGLIPATPGKSHQAVRDIALIRNIPEIEIVEPCNEQEAYLATKYVVEKLPRSAYVRFANCKGLAKIELPRGYEFIRGRGCILKDGHDIAIISAGPIMLAQALGAADRLAQQGLSARIINLPWHTSVDAVWLKETLGGIINVFVVDNHVANGGQSEEIRKIVPVINISVEGFAETGQPMETLAKFGLDGASIAERIRDAV